jgi:monoamine oxidase
MTTLPMLHFVSAAGLNIPTLSAKRVAHYQAAGLLREPLDVFTLGQRPFVQLAQAEALMENEALPIEQVLAGINAVLPLSLIGFLRALGIPAAGPAEIEALAKRVNTFEGLLALCSSEQAEVPSGVTPAAWTQLVGFLTTERHQQKLREFGELVPVRPYQAPPASVTAQERLRVLIVGAGLCGGQLARRLLQKSPALEVKILDEGREPGGRMLSRTLPDSDWTLEFGAARFNRRQHPRMFSLIEEFNLPVAPFPTERSSTRVRTQRATAPLTILEKALNGSSATAQLRTPFLEYAHARLSPKDIDYLVATQGYDVLLNPQLPASEVVRILNDHPETSENENEWLRVVPGFQEIVKRLHQEVTQLGGSHRFQSQVNTLKRLPGGGLRVYCEDGHIEMADQVILTAPKHGLEQMRLPIDAARRQALQSVEAVPLMKAFFLFPDNWWKELGFADDSFLITDTPLRKIYFRPGHLVIYNDSATARYWEPLCGERAASSGLLWRAVSHYLREVLELPGDFTLPEPAQHFSKFWPAGVYFWKPGTAPERVQRELLAPADTLHICSEAYSPHSGWGEAALSSAELLLEQLPWLKLAQASLAHATS